MRIDPCAICSSETSIPYTSSQPTTSSPLFAQHPNTLGIARPATLGPARMPIAALGGPTQIRSPNGLGFSYLPQPQPSRIQHPWGGKQEQERQWRTNLLAAVQTLDVVALLRAAAPARIGRAVARCIEDVARQQVLPVGEALFGPVRCAAGGGGDEGTYPADACGFSSASPVFSYLILAGVVGEGRAGQGAHRR